MDFSKEYTVSKGRLVTIDETQIPLSGLENIDIKTGDTLVMEIEITVYEPDIRGFRGMVHKAKTTGYRTLSGIEDISKIRDDDS